MADAADQDAFSATRLTGKQFDVPARHPHGLRQPLHEGLVGAVFDGRRMQCDLQATVMLADHARHLRTWLAVQLQHDAFLIVFKPVHACLYQALVQVGQRHHTSASDPTPEDDKDRIDLRGKDHPKRQRGQHAGDRPGDRGFRDRIDPRRHQAD